jgi:hypothetical protein
MMKIPSIAKKILAYSGTFILTFAAAGVTTFSIMNSQTPTSTPGGTTTSGGGDAGTGTPTENFTSNLVAAAVDCLDGTVDFSLEIPNITKDGTYFTVSMSDAAIKFKMPSLSDIGLSLDAPVNVNGSEKKLGLTIADKVAYFSIADSNSSDWDIRYKLDLNERTKTDESGATVVDEDGDPIVYTYGDLDVLVDDIVDALGGEEAVSVDGSGLSDSIDTDTLMADLGAMESEQIDGGYAYYCTLHLTDSLTLNLMFESDSDYNLTRVKLPGYKSQTSSDPDYVELSNGMRLSLDLDCDVTPVTFKAPTDADSYRKLTNSLGLFDAIYPIVESPRFEASFEGSLSHVVSEASDGAEEQDEFAKITLQSSVDYADESNPRFDADIAVSSVSEAGETLHTKSLSTVFDGASAYLDYASGLLKAKMSKATMDSLVGKLSSANLGTYSEETHTQINDLCGQFADKAKLLNTVKLVENGAYSIVNGEFVSSLKNGHYETLLEFVKTISTQDNLIVIGFDLSKLGLTGSLSVTVDAREGSDGLLKVEFENIGFASFTFSGTLKAAGVSDSSSAIVSAPEDASAYEEITHLPTVYDQLQGMVDAKQAYLTVSGSVYDATDSAVGFDFSGDTAFDVSLKSGTGSIAFIDHKTGKADQTYKLNIDVLGVDKMLFTYNSGSADNTLKGKFTIDTLNDMIDLVKTLLASDDERFTKFFTSLDSMAADTLMSRVLNNELNSLIEIGVLKSASLGASETALVLNGQALGLDGDLSLNLAYKDDKSLASVGVAATTGGKAVNLSVGLGTFGSDTALSRLDVSDTYMDFSDIAVLMRYVYSDATMETYHLSASGSAKFGLINIDALSTEFWLSVDGATVKLYGYVELPIVVGLNSTNLLGGTRKTTFYYGTTDDCPQGTLYMYRKDDKTGTLWDKKYRKKVDGKNFLENMPGWILGFAMGMNDSIMDDVTEPGDTSSEPMYFEDVLKSFSYDSENVKWDLTMDMGALTHSDMLGDMDLTMYGMSDHLTKFDMDLGLTIGLLKASVNLSAALDNVGGDGTESDAWSAKEETYASYLSSHSGDSYDTDWAV